MTVDDKIASLEASIDALTKKSKGFSSQISLLRAKTGMGRPGETQKEVETSPNQALATESKPQEAEKNHVAYTFMRDCPECGGLNPNYKAPNLFCDGPECKGVIPLGTIDTEKDIVKKEDGMHIDSVKECWNCGASGDGLHVIVKEPKK